MGTDVSTPYEVGSKISDGSPWLPQKNSRICSRHFVKNVKSESQAKPAYRPTLFPDVYKKRRVIGERHERWAKWSRSAARNLTSPHPPEESSPVDVLSNASETDCSPDANAQSKALEQGSLLLTEEDGAKREATVNGVPNSGKKEFAPGREVWSRQYSQLGQRWLPGTVATVEGKRLLTVNTPRGVQRRHVDQVRPRDSSTPVKKEPCETPMAMEQLPLSSSGIQSTSSEALQAGLSEPGEEASGGGIEPASPRFTAEPLSLRRSTRARKPPDRF
ncbi:hypothetical protein MRX96_044641 [Rhipicephalus microplus]